MAYAPKTPNHRRSRSEAKAPLTPSLVAGLNSVNLASGTRFKQAETPNPFASASRPSSSKRTRAVSTGRPTSSRPSSPSKRPSSGCINVTDSLQKQASSGIVRKGGIESRLDVVTRDYVPPPKSEKRRSKSQPAVSKYNRTKVPHILTCDAAGYPGSLYHYSRDYR